MWGNTEREGMATGFPFNTTITKTQVTEMGDCTAGAPKPVCVHCYREGFTV